MDARLGQADGVEVQDLGDRLLITRRWLYWTSIPLGLFALAWIGLTLGRVGHDLLNACNCLFLGLGLLALYISVVSVANKTEIEVDHQELTVRHGPLPSLETSKTMAVRDISHLVLEKIKMSGNLSGSSRYWALHMVDECGDKRVLIGSMPDWNQAETIRQEIEGFLTRVRSENEGEAA
jgi:hypothetical protein